MSRVARISKRVGTRNVQRSRLEFVESNFALRNAEQICLMISRRTRKNSPAADSLKAIRREAQERLTDWNEK
jgi:hypothetical protein